LGAGKERINECNAMPTPPLLRATVTMTLSMAAAVALGGALPGVNGHKGGPRSSQRHQAGAGEDLVRQALRSTLKQDISALEKAVGRRKWDDDCGAGGAAGASKPQTLAWSG
jgi:hypothetical protein